MNSKQSPRHALLALVVACLVAPPTALRGAAAAEPAARKSLAGVWQATLKVQGIELRLVLHVAAAGDGYQATLDSPDQGAKGIAVDRVTLEGDAVKLELKKIKAFYEGKLNRDGQNIEGQWTQGAPLPLDFKRLDKAPDFRRPQEPKKPYPYREEEVVYENRVGGVTLAGTLTCPASDKPAPAVLLISGSGPGTEGAEAPVSALPDRVAKRVRQDRGNVGARGARPHRRLGFG